MQILTSAVQRLLLKAPASSGRNGLFQSGSASGSIFRPRCPSTDNIGAALGHADQAGNQWQTVVPLAAASALQPWDAAHELSRRVNSDTGVDAYVEPDFLQQPALRDRPVSIEGLDADVCQPSAFNGDWEWWPA